MNVSEITKELKTDQTNVSHNLKKLKLCGFVDSKKEGKYRDYHLNKKTIFPILKLIDKHMEKNCLMIIKNRRRKK